jgi:hypothetical protein
MSLETEFMTTHKPEAAETWQEDFAWLEQQLLTDAADDGRIACPVLLLALGGTGAEVLRRVKAQTQSLGMSNFFRFLVVDMDRAPQQPKGALPGFEDHEFCYLPRTQVRNVFKHPSHHDGLVQRLDLTNSETKRILHTIANKDESGAGQVRPMGLLGLYANYQTFINRLHDAITDLTGRWKSLEERLKTEAPGKLQVQNRFYAVVVSSVCGGTGSSTLIDIAAILQNELDDREAHISVVLALPEVYEKAVKAKPAQFPRMLANSYATVLEKDFFQNGYAYEKGVMLAGVDDTGRPAPATLFDRIYLVERTDADGYDLGTIEAVYDTIALHVTADLGHTIGGKLESEDANEAAMQGLSPCPRTGRQRIYSTFGASALSVPVAKIRNYCTFKQAFEFINETAIGQEPGADALEAEVDQWLSLTQLEERAARLSDNVIDRLKAAIPGLDGYVKPLFRQRSEWATVYHGDRVFVQKYASVRQQWKDTHLADLKRRLAEERGPLQQEYLKALATQLTRVVETKGLRHAVAFACRAKAVFQVTAQELQSESSDDLNKAVQWDTQANETLAPLNTWFGKLGTDQERQEKVSLAFRKALDANVDAEAKKVAGSVLDRLTDETETHLTALRRSVEGCEQLRTVLEKRSVEKRLAGRETHADSQAEIDVSTPEFVQEFYTDHSLKGGGIVEQLSKETGADAATIIRTIGADRDLQARLLRIAAVHFHNHLRRVNIVDVLNKELKRSPEHAQVALARLEEVIRACRPLWRAEIGIMGKSFSDSIVLGVPKSEKELNTMKKTRIGETIRNAEAVLNRDSRYQASIALCPTNDLHRIYAIRRSHGGLPYYLKSWDRCRKEYEKWERQPGHPIHTFPPAVVAMIPTLEPIEGGSEGDLAFALAMAFGWIAQRGKFFYFNLEKPDNSNTYSTVMYSHWPCVTFASDKPRPQPGAIQEMIDIGTFRFGQHKQPDPKRRLGEKGGRAEALKTFKQSPKAIQLVFGLFDELRSVAGDSAVARDLEAYVDELPQRVGKSDAMYDQIKRETEILRRLLESIRPRGGAARPAGVVNTGVSS